MVIKDHGSVLKLGLNKIGLKHLFLAVLIAGAVFAVYRHYSYIYSLSPVMRAVYEQRKTFPEKNGIWVLGPDRVVNKFVRLGMTEAEVIAFIDESAMIVSPNSNRSPAEREQYESRIVAFQHMRSGFAGWHALFFGSYTLRIGFYFNNGVLEKVDSFLVMNTL